jgi:hypothetical protein
LDSHSRIPGKSSVPTLKKGGATPGWRIEYDAGFKITHYEDDPVCFFDEENKKVRLTLKRDALTPVGVLKSLMKIGLTLMPESEIANIPHALAWIQLAIDMAIPYRHRSPAPRRHNCEPSRNMYARIQTGRSCDLSEILLFQSH